MTTYRQNNWVFDPETDLDYENKFFEIRFDSNINSEMIDKVWRIPLRDFLESEGKGKVLSGFPDASIIGFFLEDVSKKYLLKFLEKLKNFKIPKTISIIRWKNHKESQIFNSFLAFQSYVEKIVE